MATDAADETRGAGLNIFSQQAAAMHFHTNVLLSSDQIARPESKMGAWQNSQLERYGDPNNVGAGSCGPANSEFSSAAMTPKGSGPLHGFTYDKTHQDQVRERFHNHGAAGRLPPQHDYAGGAGGAGRMYVPNSQQARGAAGLAGFAGGARPGFGGPGGGLGAGPSDAMRQRLQGMGASLGESAVNKIAGSPNFGAGSAGAGGYSRFS